MKNKIKLPRVAQVGGDRATHNTKAKGWCRSQIIKKNGRSLKIARLSYVRMFLYNLFINE